MKKRQERAFTVVELVIVIAVIAVLAAVLIPTFTMLINRANESSDTQNAKNMNTALSAETEKPETLCRVWEILSDYGYNPAPTAMTNGYAFYWNKTENVIALANGTEFIYPAQLEGQQAGEDSILLNTPETDEAAHAPVTIPGKEPTLTEDGLSESVQCSVCKKFLKEAEVISLGDQGFIINNTSGMSVLVSYIGEEKNVVIPEGVHAVRSDVFCNNKEIESITFPSSLYAIGENEIKSFEGCTNLKSVTFADNSRITTVPKMTFLNCTSLETVDFGENSRLTTIEGQAFGGCSSLKEITIPATVTSIGDKDQAGAFDNCSSLEMVYFEEGSLLEKIGSCTFWFCKNLKEINLENCTSLKAIYHSAFAGCTNLSSITIPASVETIETSSYSGLFVDDDPVSEAIVSLDLENMKLNYTVANPYSLKEIVVAEGNTHFKVVNGALMTADGTKIIAYATAREHTGAYVIPEGVTTIASHAFAGSLIEEFVIPASVKTIEQKAFFGCSAMKKITFSKESALTTIGQESFKLCFNLEAIELPSLLTSIGSYAFNMCNKIEEIVIPKTVTVLGRSVFMNLSDETLQTGKMNAPLIYIYDGITDNSTWNENHCPVFVYSENQPTENPGNYWHMVDGVPTRWE